MVNGKIVAQGSQFSLNDVEVVTATVDLEEVRAYRFAPSRGFQVVQAPTYDRIEVDFALSQEESDIPGIATAGRPARYHFPEEEIVSFFKTIIFTRNCSPLNIRRSVQRAGFGITVSVQHAQRVQYANFAKCDEARRLATWYLFLEALIRVQLPPLCIACAASLSMQSKPETRKSLQM